MNLTIENLVSDYKTTSSKDINYEEAHFLYLATLYSEIYYGF